MNKSDIIKQVNAYLDTQDIVYANTIYEKREVRRQVTRTTAQLRTISDGEIVIEIDTDNALRSESIFRKVVKRLKANGYSFVAWKADGQRSPHIHLYDVKGLDKLNHKVNRNYKKLWFEKYAPWREVDVGINTKTINLLAMEEREHFKYGTKKEIIMTYLVKDTISNKLEPSIAVAAREYTLAQRDKVLKTRKQKRKNYNNNWIVTWLTSEELPKGSRNSIILKNLAILIHNHNLDFEEIVESLELLYDGHVRSQMRNWLDWVRQGHNEFFIWELMKFCNDYDIDFYRVKDRYAHQKNGKKITKKV